MVSKRIPSLAAIGYFLLDACPAWAIQPDIGDVATPVSEQPSGPTAFMSFFPLLVIMGIFYFIIIAPQRKQQKETEKMQSALKKGDRVITNSGILGTVTDLKDAEKVQVVEVAPNVRVNITPSYIASIKKQEQITAK